MTELAVSYRKVSVSIVGRDGRSASILRDIDLDVTLGQAVGIVGETGSGKSMTLRALFDILPDGSRLTGDICIFGRPRDAMPRSERRSLLQRNGLSMVFQDARSSLHPTATIGRQLTWALRGAGVRSRAEIRTYSDKLLSQVGLPVGKEMTQKYPFEISGGMCQRAAIAIALATQPRMLVADEITSALDPTIALDIAEMLRDRIRELNMTLLFVSHDIHMVSLLCDEICVMREGRIVERGPTAEDRKSVV